MSIQFNWEKLTEDSEEIEQNVCDFLNQQFESIPLPEFISSLSVTSFKLGSSPPEVVFKHFSDPFPEFYQTEDEDESDRNSDLDNPDVTTIRHSSPVPDHPVGESSPVTHQLGDDDSGAEQDNIPEVSPFDVQSYVELKYDSDMQLALSATLLVNYPAPSFISLPLSIKVSHINIHALVVAASIKRRIHISVMSDVHDKDVVPAEQVDVIKSMRIESEIGDNSDHGAMLRNVGKAEKFVVEQLRNVIRDELVWPGWLTLEL